MSIRAFRRLPRAQRRGFIDTITDPLTRRAFEIVFLGPGKVSWQKAAYPLRPCGSGPGRSCSASEGRAAPKAAISRNALKSPAQKPAEAAVRKS